MTNKWNDDVMIGAENVKNYLDFVLKERSQLYGTIIFLMISNNIQESELPSVETFRTYAENYYIIFEKAEGENLYRVALKEREDDATEV